MNSLPYADVLKGLCDMGLLCFQCNLMSTFKLPLLHFTGFSEIPSPGFADGVRNLIWCILGYFRFEFSSLCICICI